MVCTGGKGASQVGIDSGNLDPTHLFFLYGLLPALIIRAEWCDVVLPRSQHADRVLIQQHIYLVLDFLHAKEKTLSPTFFRWRIKLW